jgi:RNA polymerase-binding transcription factor DksA
VSERTDPRPALDAQRLELRHEIADLGADPDSDEVLFEADPGFSDRSHSTEERARTIAVVGALRSNLLDVDRALDKLAAGTYGTCERCGGPIAAERLEAIPWALLCIDCKRSVSA